jgi:hypothetical protein
VETTSQKSIEAQTVDLSAHNDLVRSCLGKNPPPADMAAFRDLVAQSTLLRRTLGNPSVITRECFIGRLSEERWAIEEATRQWAAELADGLAAGGASPLEAVLIDHIVDCRVALQLAEKHGLGASSGFARPGLTDSLVTAAQTRFLRAVGMLAQVRRLLRIPAVQINVAEKQVNVANLSTANEHRAVP